MNNQSAELPFENKDLKKKLNNLVISFLIIKNVVVMYN